MIVRSRRLLCGAALIAALALLPAARQTAAASSAVGPRAYYLALGDSLGFGFQIDLQFHKGYADDFFANLKATGKTAHLINMACPGETSVSFINGGCPFAFIDKYHYKGPQFAATLSFIQQHPAQVSPVTLDIGANDVLPLIDDTHCTVSSSFTATLATVDANIITILPRLQQALNRTGDLFMMNYYFPYQNECPNLLPLIEEANGHLAADAQQFNVPLADVFTAFGGAATPNPTICLYTWICSKAHDIHATTLGYSVIAQAFEQTAGY